MMIGDPPELNPTVQIPSWDYHHVEDPAAHIQSPTSHNVYPNSSDSFHYENAFAALQRYLPSNQDDAIEAGDEDPGDFEVPVDAFSCDDFRMFEFKVKKCTRAKPHDWTECPFAHPGEKARRRDPRRFHYSGSACPDFRKGTCSRGDSCEYAHGVFECWLHPARYRTQPCKDGIHCRRRVCFFAHTLEQLRVLPYTTSPDASPSRLSHDPFVTLGLFGSSPNSTMYSPPLSPTTGSPSMSVNQLTDSLQGLQINRMQVGIGLSMSPPTWKPGFKSPRSPSIIRPGFSSMSSTPIGAVNRSGRVSFDAWEISCEEGQAMERVESGRKLREKLYAKLGKENSLERVARVDFPGTGPDMG
ncbi:zinc finger CCCH domain-containing protein 23 [Dorcoceras hygrometricum]|uniref:Zinc finger CCCH domain-containing protein 23 n=1 Tax=Dorcoceras hygrometricum TaxID=472368 RepID=A0A2Z7BRG6_9LAMI|nr:zinc finger CCCH domain-containing protein 23 [Dorcoceras hygrometricum]